MNKNNNDKDSNPSCKGERLAKRIARAGICSRRDAEKVILEGRVCVSGKVINTPAFNVQESDIVTIDGEPIQKAEKARLWRYYKPSGLVTSHKDNEGRPTVFENLPPNMPRVISVGRLDLNSEGLLLLTNDGELARKLEMPSSGWIRRYRVRVYGRINKSLFDNLEKGVEIEGIKYGSVKVVHDSTSGANSWLTISLKEGKNREIRKLMEHIGLQVTRLIRVAYGPFQLGSLEKSMVSEVSSKVLKEQIGSFLS